MSRTRLTASLTLLALTATVGLAHAQTVPVPGTDVVYVCNGGVVLDVAYRSQSAAQVNYGGVTYTLSRRNFGPVQAGSVIRYSDPVTSWNLGSRGAFLNQNGRTVVSGCFPTDGGGSSTVIPVNPGGGTSTVIPVPGFGPTPPPSPTVNTVTYTCDGGLNVRVSYLGTNVAQVSWRDITDTFYETPSGSGVSYSNGFYTWITKGNQGFLQQTGLNQDDVIIANNCVSRS